MEDYKEFSREQVSAITRSIKLGRTLKEDHPEIAVIYGYYSQTDIPKMLDIQSEYGVGDGVAVIGVHRAINGHEEGFGIEGYVGLITDEEERERIGREHMVQGGQKAYEQGAGIHGRTAEQMSKDGRKGGQKAYEQGAGVHGRTAEQMSKGGRKGGQKAYEQGAGVHGRIAEQHSEDGRKGAIAKGQTPWSDEEKEFAYMLSLESEYQHPKGPNRGKPNNELITLELNIQYHDCNEVRSNRAVSVQLSKYKKSLDDVVA